MKYFTLILVVAQAVLIQNAYSQCIRTGGPIVVSSPVITTISQPSVAASLADTLSLLTVSSLLSECLPLNPNVVAAVPVAVSINAYAPMSYGGCGCGRGCGCGCSCGGTGYGYNYIM